MFGQSYISHLFRGAVLTVYMTHGANADEPFLPDLQGINGFRACHSSYDLNLRAKCNVSGLQALANLYNEADQSIIDSALNSSAQDSQIERLQTECGEKLLDADAIVRSMRKRSGIFLASDINAARREVQSAAEECLPLYRDISETVGQASDFEEAVDFFSPDPVR